MQVEDKSVSYLLKCFDYNQFQINDQDCRNYETQVKQFFDKLHLSFEKNFLKFKDVKLQQNLFILHQAPMLVQQRIQLNNQEFASFQKGNSLSPFDSNDLQCDYNIIEGQKKFERVSMTLQGQEYKFKKYSYFYEVE